MFFYSKHTWTGESGKAYTFKCALTKHGIPNDSGGIYVFVRRRYAFFLEALYVGKAANLRGRLLGHEKWGKAWWILGATERHVLRIQTEDERRLIEEDLIRGLTPPMNDMQVPRSVNDAPTTPELRRKWQFRRATMNLLRRMVGMKPTNALPGDENKQYFDPAKHKPHEFARH